jgi:acyl carrier protein/GNAT superfamily N-acetyltransferase
VASTEASEIERELERTLQNILRDDLLLHSERPLAVDAPLAASGLDSLALVTFVTALENAFGVEIPEDVWTEREHLTIRKLAALLAEAAPTGARRPTMAEAPRPTSATTNVAGAPLPEKIAFVLRERGLIVGAVSALPHVLRYLLGYVVERQRNVLLSRYLHADPIPAVSAAVELEFRELTESEAPLVRELYPAVLHRRKLRLFEERFRQGCTCLSAWHHGRVVAVDWLAPGDATTNVVLRPGTCLGLDLHEHRSYRGKRVGLALLAHSLEISKRRAFERQVTLVLSDNRHMLAAAVQLLGFQKVGEAERLRILGRVARWSWQIGETVGRGRSLIL